MRNTEYQDAVVRVGFEIVMIQPNSYDFLPGSAERSARKFGVHSISLLALKQ
jgi:hypothetical protein